MAFLLNFLTVKEEVHSKILKGIKQKGDKLCARKDNQIEKQ